MRPRCGLKVLFIPAMLFGCGSPDAPQSAPEISSAANQQSAGIRENSGISVTLALDSAADLPADGSTVPALPPDPADDTPGVLIQRMRQLRDQRQSPTHSHADDNKDNQVNRRRQRHLKIVELASDVLSQTLDDSDQQAEFTEAIQHLLEARYQLALSGGREDMTQLYADVQALNDRDPNSVHAAEGIYSLARFAHAKARLLGGSDPAWFENFSRWAREFADRFPEQEQRAVSLLFGAARSCELHALAAASRAQSERLMTEAQMCYVQLVDHFGETKQAQEAAAVLRRLALPGTRLSQFAGPALDGDYVDAEDFVDQVTVIYFWEIDNPEFVNQLLPLLQQADAVSDDQLRFIGVPLDQDEARLRAFLKEHDLPGRQIFSPEAAQRSWNSPLIRFWGVSRCPTVWLVDGRGIVSAVDIGPSELVDQMRILFR
ncbi:MAG: TlpA disulfide reductase family protein [Planctomycetaceae bacterium]